MPFRRHAALPVAAMLLGLAGFAAVSFGRREEADFVWQEGYVVFRSHSVVQVEQWPETDGSRATLLLLPDVGNRTVLQDDPRFSAIASFVGAYDRYLRLHGRRPVRFRVKGRRVEVPGVGQTGLAGALDILAIVPVSEGYRAAAISSSHSSAYASARLTSTTFQREAADPPTISLLFQAFHLSALDQSSASSAASGWRR